MKHINKKGQVMQNIGALGVGIAALVIILAVIFLVMAQLKTQTIEQGTATAITNESVASWVNDTAQDVDRECMQIVCETLYNDSSNTEVIGSGNFTCTILGDLQAQITVVEQDGWTFNSTDLWLDYSCVPGSIAFNSTLELTNATATIPGWVPLIILVAIGGIILGLVSAFKRQD